MVAIRTKNAIIMMFFGCFLQHDLFAMQILQEFFQEMTSFKPKKVSHRFQEPVTAKTLQYCSLKDSLEQEKDPVTGLSKKDLKALEIGLGKMLNFSSWLELQYSIQAVITPWKGKSDQRIQKYVDKWALSIDDARNITEKVVGACLKALYKSKNIDLNNPDSTGFLPSTLAVYTGDLAVVHILMAAGVDFAKTDRYGYTPLALAKRFRHTSIFEELSKKTV